MVNDIKQANNKEGVISSSNKQNLYKDAILEQDWITLIDKHKLRYEIWTILKLHNELNVTEITHLVKQSKSTVSRILIQMEEDLLIKSRRAEKKEEEGEKIPPKYYRLNKEFGKFPEFDDLKEPTDPSQLRKFYLSNIKNIRNTIYNYHKLLDLLTPMLNIFEEELEDIDTASHIYQSYLSDKNEPLFNTLYFDSKFYDEFFDIRLEYLLKLTKLAREQELNSDNAFVYFDASLPLKSIFQMKKEMLSKKK